MASGAQRQWQIAARPVGRPLQDSDFKLASAPVPVPGAGEVLLRTLYLSLDPAQKSWIESTSGYM
ncbi:MAG: NADP-dependent oxidoreductase, partial [Alphaproteobacteria bacterium]